MNLGNVDRLQQASHNMIMINNINLSCIYIRNNLGQQVG